METQYMIEQEYTQPEQSKRPGIISMVSVFELLLIALIAGQAFSDVISEGGWYPLYLTLIALLSIPCILGIRQMKKWAVSMYTVLVVFHQVILLTAELWVWQLLLMPGLLVIASWAHAKKMSGPAYSWVIGTLGGVVVAVFMYFFIIHP
ncbi:MAG: hypothetical protein KF687_16715 [Cyclobacteriaceae bacterium]|nr:hypothetical protein [Cyclobacteriaceae bacterium]